MAQNLADSASIARAIANSYVSLAEDAKKKAEEADALFARSVVKAADAADATDAAEMNAAIAEIEALEALEKATIIEAIKYADAIEGAIVQPSAQYRLPASVAAARAAEQRARCAPKPVLVKGKIAPLSRISGFGGNNVFVAYHLD
jgi:hypothetical protein